MGQPNEKKKTDKATRKVRGRTINRRRERFIRKAAKKLAKLVEAGKDPSQAAHLNSQIKASEQAQALVRAKYAGRK